MHLCLPGDDNVATYFRVEVFSPNKVYQVRLCLFFCCCCVVFHKIVYITASQYSRTSYGLVLGVDIVHSVSAALAQVFSKILITSFSRVSAGIYSQEVFNLSLKLCPLCSILFVPPKKIAPPGGRDPSNLYFRNTRTFEAGGGMRTNF